MSVALPVSPLAAPAGAPIRVMVVDDSAVVRGLVSRWIEAEPDLALAASLRTGRDAVDGFERADPDVVILDVDMPDLDGLSALPLLLAKKRDLVVVMASTLTRRNAEVSLKALALGAADYVPKPESRHAMSAAADFRRELVDKIRHLGRRRRIGPPPANARSRLAPRVAKPASLAVTLRPIGPVAPRALVIGCSTGGPQALSALLPKLTEVSARAPILITQHMPPTFTTILAEHLTQVTGRTVKEGVDGEIIVPGTIYVAPGGHHMRVARHEGRAVVAIDDGPPINFCRPSVDPLFASASRVWGGTALALILTGMGSDGVQGAAEIAHAGGTVIAQDEATSVVWGMPGAAAHAGVCSAVMPLDQIAPKIARLFAGDRT